MGEDFWDIFINNLWQRENAQGYKEIEGKGGYHNGRYYPYMTNDGRWDVGPGFYLDDQPESFQEKAKTTGFTKQELNDTIRQRLHNEPQYFKQRIIKEGGNPTRVTNDVYAGLLDMFWQRNNGLYQDFPNLWKAVAKQDYESMRKESRTKYYNLKTGKDEIDTGRWNFRKQAYFHDPQSAANTHASTFVQQIDADRQGIDSLVSVPNYLKQKPITVPYRVKADGGSIRHKQWDDLSMSEISDIIGAAVRNGITTLPEIRQKWNEFSLSEDEKVNSEESDRSEGSDGKNGANRPYGEDDDITGYIGPEVTITAQYPYEQRVIDTMNASSPEFLERLRNNNRRDIDNGDGTHSTHRLGSADNIVFPEIQDVNGQLVDYKNLPWQQQVQKAIENNDYIAFPTEGDARYFGEHYKKYFPIFFNQLYSDGGNLFKSGGYVPSMAVKKDISNWEGDSMKTNRSFEAEAKDFNRVIPQSIQDNLNQQQLDALYSYGYNVGMGNLKKRVLPTLSNFVNGRAGAEDVASHMWASRDKELRGLRRRRAWERNKFIGNTPYKNRQSIITEALQADLSNLPSEKDIQMEQPLLPPNPTYYGSIVDYQLPQQPMNESMPVTTSNDKDMDMMRLMGFMRSMGLLGDGSGDTFMAKAPARSKYTIGAYNDYDTLLDSSWYRKGGPLYAEGGRKDGDPYSTLDYVTPRELWFDGSGRAHTVNGNIGPIVLQDVDVTTKKNGAGLKDDNGNYYNTSSKSYPRLYGDKTGNDINNVMLGTMALGTAPMTLPEIAAVSTMAGNAASDALMSTKAGQAVGNGLNLFSKAAASSKPFQYGDWLLTSAGLTDAANDVRTNNVDLNTVAEALPAAQIFRPLAYGSRASKAANVASQATQKTETIPFKSELDWSPESWFGTRATGKWDAEDVAALQSHVPEYLTIEQKAKADGTWLKMPDGSKWEGDPRSWVQLQSKAYDTYTGNSPFKYYPFAHTTDASFDTFDYNYFGQTDLGFYGKGFYTHPAEYINGKLTGRNSYGDKTYLLTTNVQHPFDLNKGRDFQYAGLFNWPNTNAPTGTFDGYDSVYKGLSQRPDMRIGADIPELVVPEPTNYKSLVGNNGNFDAQNPNMFKSLLPFALTSGTGFSLLNTNQNGNSHD